MWFRVDDEFWRHPKIASVEPRYRNPMAGLWVRAGSWSAYTQSDGKLPKWLPRELDATSGAVERLEQSGLWVPDDAGGWVIHDWPRWSKSQERAERERKYDRERKRASRRADPQ